MNINFDELVPQLDENVFAHQEIDATTEENPIETDGKQLEEPVIEESIEETPEPEPASPDDVATLFYKELVEQGIASDLQKEGYSWEDVNKVINDYREELPKQVTEAIITSSPEFGQSLIDYIFTKGSSLSREDLKQFMQDYLDDVETLEKDITFDTNDSARQFLTSTYKNQGFRDSQIEAMLDALEDESDTALKDEAKKYFEKQKENLKSTQKLQEAKIQKQSQETSMQQFAMSIQEELKNTGWKPTRVNKIREALVSGETNTVLKKASTSPKALIQLANLATYYDEKTGVFKFDDFVKQELTPETKQLKDRITRDMFSTGTTTRGQLSNPNKGRLGDLVPTSPLD